MIHHHHCLATVPSWFPLLSTISASTVAIELRESYSLRCHDEIRRQVVLVSLREALASRWLLDCAESAAVPKGSLVLGGMVLVHEHVGMESSQPLCK